MPSPIGKTPPLSPLSRSQDLLERSLRRLGSLQRITRASEDAAGLGISEQLRAAERGLTQGARNLADGVSLARTAEGALSGIHDQLGRLRELSVQAQNGTLDDTARGAIQAEFDAITAEITRSTEATTFNGRKLLDGSLTGSGALTLNDGSGNGANTIDFQVGSVSAQSLGVEGLSASDPNALDAIDAAIGQVSSSRAELGALESRLESGIRNLGHLTSNLAESRSRIADADVAAESAELARAEILRDINIAVRSQARISSQAALALLR